MNTVFTFLEDILTGRISGVRLKDRAVTLYKDLISNQIRLEMKNQAVKEQGQSLLSIPVRGNVIRIGSHHLNHITELYKSGQKISAIRAARQYAYVEGREAEGGLSLKDAKDFVESL